jgi:polyhydroxyalkanoate synthesis regulator phasin
MLDAMRGYLHAANGLTELTRKRAQELAQGLLAAGGPTSTVAVATQVSAAAEELINAAKANRAAVREMVRGEVEVAVARLGLVPAAELARAHQKIATLEARVADLVRGGAGAASGGPARARTTRPASESGLGRPASSRPNRAAVKRAAVSAADNAAAEPVASARPVASRATAKKTAAKKTAAKKTATKKTTATKRAAKKVPAKKVPAKKAAAKQTAKRTQARRAPGPGRGAESGS